MTVDVLVSYDVFIELSPSFSFTNFVFLFLIMKSLKRKNELGMIRKSYV